MTTTYIIIILCVLLLNAYAFDITASKTKIPAVILLLLLGWLVRQIVDFMEINIPNLSPVLPILGTVGLILIVLEGSLELELNKSKLKLVRQSSLIALIPMLVLSFILAFLFQYFGNVSFKIALANAIPLAIISSAIAIPSAKNLDTANREFITYESSLSDIFGVIFFNFITLNDNIGTQSVGMFFVEIAIIVLISFVGTLGLALLLKEIKFHHVKFIPIILSIVLIYAVSKIYHLPALVFILLFGLFLGNLDELANFKIIKKLKPEVLEDEVHKFKDLTAEVTFLMRALFFILFGFLINTSDLLNISTLVWALGIIILIFGIRFMILKLTKYPIYPLLFIAPRGLITILLFLSMPTAQNIKLVNNSLLIQVILLTALVMMYGSLKSKENKVEEVESKHT